MKLTEEQRANAKEKNREARARRKTDLAACTVTYESLLARFPTHSAKVEALRTGSLKAALSLKCLDCCNGQMDEVRHCNATGCPIWPLRPWKGHSNSVEHKKVADAAPGSCP